MTLFRLDFDIRLAVKHENVIFLEDDVSVSLLPPDQGMGHRVPVVAFLGLRQNDGVVGLQHLLQLVLLINHILALINVVGNLQSDFGILNRVQFVHVQVPIQNQF